MADYTISSEIMGNGDVLGSSDGVRCVGSGSFYAIGEYLLLLLLLSSSSLTDGKAYFFGCSFPGFCFFLPLLVDLYLWQIDLSANFVESFVSSYRSAF